MTMLLDPSRIAAVMASERHCQRIACAKPITGEPVRADGHTFCGDECRVVWRACRENNVPTDDTGWSWAPPMKARA